MQILTEWTVHQLKEIVVKMDKKFAKVVQMNLTPQKFKEYESA